MLKLIDQNAKEVVSRMERIIHLYRCASKFIMAVYSVGQRRLNTICKKIMAGTGVGFCFSIEVINYRLR